MDPLTIIGVVVGFAVIFGAMVMEGGSPAALFLPAPLLLVFIGTMAVGMAGTSLPSFKHSLLQLKVAFTSPLPQCDDLVNNIVRCAETARRDGLLALEMLVTSIDDAFLRRGLELAIDGTDPEELASILEAEVHAAKERGTTGAKFFNDLGAYAPTIGIIGTVLGLVQVLGNLSDPGELGHMIAAAFVATLWGVLSANVLWLPIAKKLTLINDLQNQQREVVIEGVLAIQAGANPRTVDRKLRALLPPEASKPTDKAA